MGKYYIEDTAQRKNYFDDQFFSLSRSIASNQGLSPKEYFRNLTSYNNFKKYLQNAFSQDESLLHYYQGMGERAKQEFYHRTRIQHIVRANKQEGLQLTLKDFPIKVMQVQKQIRKYYTAYIKGKRTRAYESTFKKQGRTRIVYRDQKGRFSKKA